MSNRVQNGRIGKQTTPYKKRYPAHAEPYFFKPTPENRRLHSYNKARYVFNFSEWNGKTIHELAYEHRDRGQAFLLWILGEKFDLASRPDLVIALRSLHSGWYTDFLFPYIADGLAKRGFKRGTIRGSKYEIAMFPKHLNPNLQVYISSEKTPFDNFFDMESPHKASQWAKDKPEVIFDAEPLSALRPEVTNVEQGGSWDTYPIRVSFYGVPIRIERLFLDDPEKKGSYLTIAPCGIRGDGEEQFLYLTMKLDEKGRTPNEMLGMLGLPYHFSGALHSTEDVDLEDTHFEKVEDEFAIRTGLRFEMMCFIVAVDEGKISVKPDWKNPQSLKDGWNRETMHMTLQEGVEPPVVGEKYLAKGIIPPPYRGRWAKGFDWKHNLLPDGIWKACAFDRIAK
ncbi:uncharacterized protein J4E78_005817 [Alternaria triticimaculans]|uniref:uncharacterized protein n=1 Tax=Alternaria triticimaculans TaxID=297637 RepID=UPI0020C4CC1D|nr:uncharacterized protein J4E78_005817 [Alternaria triticimaculans]KAI4659390.1 hypothetical protein J4E78_005817 [Alternaria triticimaculans]